MAIIEGNNKPNNLNGKNTEDDMIFGFGASDLLTGDADDADGNPNTNPLVFSNDTIYGAGGHDEIYGEFKWVFGGSNPGNPTFPFQVPFIGVGLTMVPTIPLVGPISLQLAQFDLGEDVLYGDAGDDLISGDVGDAFVELVASPFPLSSQVYNPILGSDEVNGGTGSDRLYGDGVITDLDFSGDSMFALTNLDPGLFFIGLPSVIGGHDTIRGDDGADRLVGDFGTNNTNFLTGSDLNLAYLASGNDSLSGGAGNDILIGDNEQNNVVDLGAGNTVIVQLGNDALFGGTGNDILWGDEELAPTGSPIILTGADVFIYDFAIKNGADTIMDFELGYDYLRFDHVTDVGAAGLTAADVDAKIASFADDGTDVKVTFTGQTGSITFAGIGDGTAPVSIAELGNIIVLADSVEI